MINQNLQLPRLTPWLVVTMFILVSKFLIADSLVPIAIRDTYGIDPSVYHWTRVPVLFGRAEISAIDSSRPLISCARVLELAERASALLKRIFQEQEVLAGLLRQLKDAAPDAVDALVWKVRKVAASIDRKTQKLQKLYPEELQKKDRVRTLYWQLGPHNFAELHAFPRMPKIEWAQLEVLSGEGGWYGKFISSPAQERPVRKRFEEFLTQFDRNPTLKEQVRQEFSGLLRSINERFAAGTAGARGQLDWQGSSEITLMQELSPVEACVPHLHLTSALLLDFDVAPELHYPNPAFPSTHKNFRLGIGPVILTYYSPRGQ